MMPDKDRYHFETIMANMCRVVGADYNKLDTARDGWYSQHRWDEPTKKRFGSWLAEYIHKIPSAQRELYGRSSMRKKDCISAANMFVFNYGWKDEN